MSTQEKKTIGILGGMGPLATADLFQKIVLLTKADTDREHIRVYIDSNANIPDRTAAILSGGEDPVPEMASALRHLEACGADCIIMPCNTAHYFLPRLQAMTKIPFLSILTAAAEACKAQFPGKTVGILATRGTLAANLYQEALVQAGVPYLVPDAQAQDAAFAAKKAQNTPTTQTAEKPQRAQKQNRFINYTQSEWDFAELERLEREQREKW